MQPTLTGQHCGGIADPDLIGAWNSEVVQSVRRDGSAAAAISDGRSILGALSSEDPLQAHKAGNAVAPSRTTQRMSQSWAAVRLATASKFLSDALAQAEVFRLTRPGWSAP